MQLASKKQFTAAQFEALIKNNLGFIKASHANEMAKTLASHLKNLKAVKITQDAEANALFVTMKPELYRHLNEYVLVYLWDESQNEYRLVCSNDSTISDVEIFVDLIRSYESIRLNT